MLEPLAVHLRRSSRYPTTPIHSPTHSHLPTQMNSGQDIALTNHPNELHQLPVEYQLDVIKQVRGIFHFCGALPKISFLPSPNDDPSNTTHSQFVSNPKSLPTMTIDSLLLAPRTPLSVHNTPGDPATPAKDPPLAPIRYGPPLWFQVEAMRWHHTATEIIKVRVDEGGYDDCDDYMCDGGFYSNNDDQGQNEELMSFLHNPLACRESEQVQGGGRLSKESELDSLSSQYAEATLKTATYPLQLTPLSLNAANLGEVEEGGDSADYEDLVSYGAVVIGIAYPTGFCLLSPQLAPPDGIVEDIIEYNTARDGANPFMLDFVVTARTDNKAKCVTKDDETSLRGHTTSSLDPHVAFSSSLPMIIPTTLNQVIFPSLGSCLCAIYSLFRDAKIDPHRLD